MSYSAQTYETIELFGKDVRGTYLICYILIRICNNNNVQHNLIKLIKVNQVVAIHKEKLEVLKKQLELEERRLNLKQEKIPRLEQKIELMREIKTSIESIAAGIADN